MANAGGTAARLDVAELLENDARKLRQILRLKSYSEKLRDGRILGRGGFVPRPTIDKLAPALVRCIEGKNRNVRVNALNLLVDLGPASAQPVLLRLIDGDDSELRSWAASGLKKLQRCGPDLLEPLLAALGNRDNWVRIRACEALFRLDDVHEIPVARLLASLRALRDPATDVVASETMAWLLARNAASDVPQLVDGLASDVFGIRLASLKALYLLEPIDESVLPRVEALVDDDPAIGVWATIASARFAPREDLPRRIPSLTDVIARRDWPQGNQHDFRLAAFGLLAGLGERAAASVPAILAAKTLFGRTAWETPIEAFGASAIPQIHTAIESGVVEDYDGIVWLGKLRDAGALALVDRMVAKGRYPHTAAECYGLFGNEGVARVSALLRDPARAGLAGYAVAGLRHAGDEALPLLADTLKAGSPAAKRSAAFVAAGSEDDLTFRSWGGPRVSKTSFAALRPQLADLLDDATPDVRVASACALIRLGDGDRAREVLDHELAADSGHRRYRDDARAGDPPAGASAGDADRSRRVFRDGRGSDPRARGDEISGGEVAGRRDASGRPGSLVGAKLGGQGRGEVGAPRHR
jgi:HEAT repeat protein